MAKILEEHLEIKAEEEYVEYAVSTIEDRAIIGDIDGVKPVTRRLLWAAHAEHHHSKSRLVKSALIVGDTMGKFHPHGDAAIYGAMVTAANATIPLFEGEGNWGTLTDPPAAMRYCFTGETRVMTQYGLLSFEQLATRNSLALDKADTKEAVFAVSSLEKPQKTSHILNSGYQKTVTVETKNGYKVTCTSNEPFLTLTPRGYEWVKAEDLTDQDFVCLKRDHGIKSVGKKMPIELATFLGYMVGDGYINCNQTYLGFNQVDNEVFEDFLRCYRKLFSYDCKVSKREPNSYGKQKYNSWTCNSVAFRNELSIKYGLDEGTSYNRRIPDIVFEGSPEFVGNFLSALYESDGSILQSRGTSAVYLHSVSVRLLEEVSLLLRNYFGIFASSIQQERKGGSGYRIMIYGSENVRRFVENVGFRSDRRAVIRVSDTGKSNQDSIPHANYFGISSDSQYTKTQRTTFRKKYEKGRFTLGIHKSIYEKDYYYDQIALITKGERRFVYDLTVPKTNAFVANGFVVHNTNARLSEYSDTIFFDKFYLPTIDYIENYDGSRREPLVLPSLLPNALLNANFGIAPGVRTSTPSFTLPSLIKVLLEALKEGKCTPKLCLPLQYTTETGAVMRQTETLKQDLLEFYSTGNSRFTFDSPMEDHGDYLRVNRFAIADIDKAIDRIEHLRGKGVADIRDDTSTSDPYLCAYRIDLQKRLEGSTRKAVLNKIRDAFSATKSFSIQVSERFVDEDRTDGGKELHLATVPKMINTWIEYRIALERRACKFHKKQRLKDIAYLQLLRLAVKNRRFIIQALDKKINDEELAKYIAKGLKITVEEANLILDLKVRQLKALEDNKLVARIKEMREEIAGYDNRIEKPGKYIAKQLVEFAKKFGKKAINQEGAA